MEKDNHLRNLITGFIMGLVSFLPGVSGGFVAMIGGIYERMIGAIGSIFKTLKENFVFLALVFGGMALGMFVASKGIEQIYDDYKMQMLFFFLGLIILQLPDVFEISTEKEKTIGGVQIIMFVVGFAIMIAFLAMQLSGNKVLEWSMEHQVTNFVIALAMGIIVGMSKVIPGLSWATIFLALGVYEFKVEFVSHLDFYFLVALALGFGVGVLVFSKIMSVLLEKWHSQTYFLLFGIIVGSVPVIFFTIPPISGWEGWATGIIFLLLGAIVGRVVSVFSRKVRAESADKQ